MGRVVVVAIYGGDSGFWAFLIPSSHPTKPGHFWGSSVGCGCFLLSTYHPSHSEDLWLRTIIPLQENAHFLYKYAIFELKFVKYQQILFVACIYIWLYFTTKSVWKNALEEKQWPVSWWSSITYLYTNGPTIPHPDVSRLLSSCLIKYKTVKQPLFPNLVKVGGSKWAIHSGTSLLMQTLDQNCHRERQLFRQCRGAQMKTIQELRHNKAISVEIPCNKTRGNWLMGPERCAAVVHGAAGPYGCPAARHSLEVCFGCVGWSWCLFQLSNQESMQDVVNEVRLFHHDHVACTFDYLEDRFSDGLWKSSIKYVKT